MTFTNSDDQERENTFFSFLGNLGGISKQDISHSSYDHFVFILSHCLKQQPIFMTRHLQVPHFYPPKLFHKEKQAKQSHCSLMDAFTTQLPKFISFTSLPMHPPHRLYSSAYISVPFCTCYFLCPSIWSTWMTPRHSSKSNTSIISLVKLFQILMAVRYNVSKLNCIFFWYILNKKCCIVIAYYNSVYSLASNLSKDQDFTFHLQIHQHLAQCLKYMYVMRRYGMVIAQVNYNLNHNRSSEKGYDYSTGNAY